MINVTQNHFKEKKVIRLLLLLICTLIVTDLYIDFASQSSLADLYSDFLLESFILLTVFITAGYIWKKFTNEKSDKQIVLENLKETKKMSVEWEKKSRNFVSEFQAYVFKQFDTWNFSKSEKAIALMILKGKNSKEIATHRFTSERTIRNQCQAIYEKSKLNGKNELAAFFLNELIGNIELPIIEKDS